MSRRRCDTGSGTVLVLALGALLAAFAALLVALGAVAVARHRAAAAADLAALAAADRTAEGVAAACQAARRTAERQGAVLRGCRVTGLEVLVEVVVRPAGQLGRLGSAVGRARAGPTREPPVAAERRDRTAAP